MAVDVPRFIVGREAELERLRRLRTLAQQGKGSFALISGEAGIGKSTLARAIIANASDDFLIATGRCFDWTRGTPYFPWTEIVASVDRQPLQLGATDDESQPALIDPLVPPRVAFTRILQRLSERATGKPMILFLDDIHAADAASLEILRYLGHTIKTLPMLVIAAYRSDELSRRNPLYTLIPLLVREANAVRLELNPLPLAATRELVDRRFQLDDPDSEELASYLDEHAEGNPFYIDEILRSLEDRGTLRHDETGQWSLGSLVHGGVPVLLQQVIEARLQRVSEQTREMLEVASIIGSDVPLDLWRETLERDEHDLVAAAEEGLEAGILNETRGATIEFRHALIRETLYESVFPPRRRLWHRRIAEILEQSANPDPDTVANHFGQAGDPREATWLVRAGDRAWQAFARLEAGALYDRALAVMERGNPSEPELAWLCLRLATANRLAAPRQTLEYLERASRYNATDNDPLLAALIRYIRGQTLCLLDDPAGFEELIAGDRMLDELEESDRQRLWVIWRADIDARKGVVASWLASYGRYEEALSTAETYLEHIGGRGDDLRRTEGDAWDAIGTVYADLGRPDKAIPAIERAIERFIAQDNNYSAGLAAWEQNVFVAIPYFTDDVPRRHQLAARARDLWARAREVELGLHPEWAFTPVDFIEGRWDAARESSLAALESEAWSVGPLSILARIAYWRGDRDEAWARIFQGLPSGHEARPWTYPIYNTLIFQQLAVDLALDDDEIERAERWLAVNWEWLSTTGRVLRRAHHFTLTARLHLKKGEIAEAERAAHMAVETAQSPRQPLPLIDAQRVLADVLRAQGKLEPAQAAADSAVELATACQMPFHRALALLTRAEALIHAGRFVPIPGTMREAREILQRLGAEPALAKLEMIERKLQKLSPRISAPAGLSPREVEVLVLLSRGMTDAEIGEQLRISRRTVSNHVSSIYNKLGVSSRAAAARFAIEHELG